MYLGLVVVLQIIQLRVIRVIISIMNVSHMCMQTTDPSCSGSQEYVTDGHLEGRQIRYGMRDMNNDNLGESIEHIDWTIACQLQNWCIFCFNPSSTNPRTFWIN